MRHQQIVSLVNRHLFTFSLLVFPDSDPVLRDLHWIIDQQWLQLLLFCLSVCGWCSLSDGWLQSFQDPSFFSLSVCETKGQDILFSRCPNKSLPHLPFSLTVTCVRVSSVGLTLRKYDGSTSNSWHHPVFQKPIPAAHAAPTGWRNTERRFTGRRLFR